MPDLSPFAASLGPPGARGCSSVVPQSGESLNCQVLLRGVLLDGCQVLGLSADRLVLSVPGPAVLSAPDLFLPGRSVLVVLCNATTGHRHTAHLQVAYAEGPGTGPFRLEARFAYPLTPDELRLLLW